MSTSNSISMMPTPGPALDKLIKQAALNLAGRDKREAEVIMQKLLASNKREQFLFVDPTNDWYPYFIKILTELRSDEGRRKEMAEAQKAAAEQAKSATSSTQAGGSVAASAQAAKAAAEKVKEETLRVATAAGKQHLVDPSPSVFSLDLAPGVEIPALMLDVMKVTAQYAAKFRATTFLESVSKKQRMNHTFRFLMSEDPRHATFCKLVTAYRALLDSSDVATEERLEKLSTDKHVLELCADKVTFLNADVARKKAALLTDDELRRRLDWDHFTVVHTFDFKDLGLPKPAAASPPPAFITPPTGGSFIAPPTGGSFIGPPGMSARPPVQQPTFMNPSLLSGTTGDAVRRKDPVIVDDYEVNAVAPQRAAITHFVDPTTGQRVNASQLQQHMSAAGTSISAHAAEKEKERKRLREGNNLADEAEYEKNMMRRQQDLQRL